MLLNFDNLIKKYDLQISGVIQGGSHYGEELSLYDKYRIPNILLFEPAPDNFKVLEGVVKTFREVRPGIRIDAVQKALGNSNEKIQLNIEKANSGQSNSVLPLGLHVDFYPHITYEDQVEVEMVRLDDFLPSFYDDVPKFNFLELDCQGFEGEILKGAAKTLESIDYIMTEVNMAELYKGGTLVDDLDKFLAPYRFTRVETYIVPERSWGDALFLKI